MIKGGKMKNKIITLIFIIILIGISILLCITNSKDNNKDNNLTKVKVAEVTHSIFYAPQYLADHLGYFKEEGLDVEIILASGADAVMSAVLSKEVDIGFCGTEATIYVANKKEKNSYTRVNLIQKVKLPNPLTTKKTKQIK